MNAQDIKIISDNVKDKGVFNIPTFFDQNQLTKVENILKQELRKNDRVIFPIKASQNFIKLFKLDLFKLVNSRALLKIANALKLEVIAENILNSPSHLYMMDVYKSKKSKEMIIPWHNDIGLKYTDAESKKNYFQSARATILNTNTKVPARGVKFFIYMTDTESNNGALGVLPFSQHIVKALTKLIVEKKVHLNLYWNLENLREIVMQDSIRPLIENLVGKEKLHKFIKSSEFIKHSSDTLEFDSNMKKGGAVVFDEMCVHRGSKPTKNDRVVLRYLYKKKN